MALYSVVLQHRYVFQRFFYQRQMQAFKQTGVLDMATFKEAYPNINGIRPGQVCYIPQFNNAAAFARVNVSAGIGSTASPTEVSSADQSFPVLRDTSDNYYTRYDMLYNGEKLKESLETTSAEQMSSRMLTQTANVLTGACQAATLTPTHVYDISTRVPVTTDINAAKALMGDQAYTLDTLLVHPNVYFDIVKDWATTQKYNPLTGVVVLTGDLQSIFGIKYIIVSDLMPYVSGQFTCSGADIYNSFLLGNGALFFGFQAENPDGPDGKPLLDGEEGAIVEVMSPILLSTISYSFVRFNLDYILSARGMKFNGSANPLDTDLSNPANWALATNSHKQVRAVMMKSQGTAGGAIP